MQYSNYSGVQSAQFFWCIDKVNALTHARTHIASIAQLQLHTRAPHNDGMAAVRYSLVPRPHPIWERDLLLGSVSSARS